MAGYYVLKQANNGEYMFNLKAGNHETILTSETYSSKAAAQGGIASVQKNSPQDSSYERKVATNGSPFFVLKSPANGQTLGRSELYSSTSAMENGIASVKTNGPSTTVRED